jgi:hypothetical protein
VLDPVPAEARARPLAVACLVVAAAGGAVLAVSEWIHPVFSGRRYTLTPSGPLQLWTYAIVQASKAAAFACGLRALFLTATRRGPVTRLFLVLAMIGAVGFALTWIMIAITGRDDAIHLGAVLIGSDARNNGGAFFLWLAPLALGIAAIGARRVPAWLGTWAILVGVIGSRLFGILPVWLALAAEGALWSVLALLILRTPPAPLPPPRS